MQYMKAPPGRGGNPVLSAKGFHHVQLGTTKVMRHYSFMIHKAEAEMPLSTHCNVPTLFLSSSSTRCGKSEKIQLPTSVVHLINRNPSWITWFGFNVELLLSCLFKHTARDELGDLSIINRIILVLSQDKSRETQE